MKKHLAMYMYLAWPGVWISRHTEKTEADMEGYFLALSLKGAFSPFQKK